MSSINRCISIEEENNKWLNERSINTGLKFSTYLNQLVRAMRGCSSFEPPEKSQEIVKTVQTAAQSTQMLRRQDFIDKFLKGVGKKTGEELNQYIIAQSRISEEVSGRYISNEELKNEFEKFDHK